MFASGSGGDAVAAGCLAESSNIWDLGTFAADWLALAEGGEMDDSIEPLSW